MLWIKRAPWRQIEQLGLLFSLYSVAGMSSKRDRAEWRYSCTDMRGAICEHVIRAGFTWNKESIHTLRSKVNFKSKRAFLSWVLNSFENHLCWFHSDEPCHCLQTDKWRKKLYLTPSHMLGGPVILGNIFALTSSIVMDKRKYIAKNPVHTFYLGHHTKGNRTLSSFSEQ